MGKEGSLSGPVERQFAVADMADLQPGRLATFQDLLHEIGRQKADRQDLTDLGLVDARLGY